MVSPFSARAGTGNTMTQALFRKEVLEAQRGSWLGGIVLAQPLRLWVLASVRV